MAIGTAELDGLTFEVLQVGADRGCLRTWVQVHLVCLCRDIRRDFALRFVPMERDEGSLVDPISEAGGRDEDAGCGDGYDDTGLHDGEKNYRAILYIQDKKVFNY